MSEGKGIFVRGFHPGLTQNELKEFFGAFGDVEEIIFNKRQMYAIIEFHERESADLVLSREIYLRGKKLKIAQRRPQVVGPKEVKEGTNSPNIKIVKCAAKEDETESSSQIVSMATFDAQMIKFTQELEAVDLKRKVEVICTSLHKSMSPFFPGCKIFPFGSSVTGLASKESDVDIYVDIGAWKSNESDSPSNLVMKAKRILSKNYEFMKCISIPKARVPILKCFHKSTKLNCDINFQNALGVFNSNLIKFYTSLDPHLKELIMFVKYWAKINHLCGPGTFTSYAVVMLFLFYVQQMPNSTIPTVEVLQKNCKSRNVVQGWDCHFDDDPRNYAQRGNLRPFIKILSGFFSFYANFEFEKNVVILNYGVSVSRDLFASPRVNLSCYRYMATLQQRNADPIEMNRTVCVLDPFLLNHNITASVDLRVMNRFQIRCYKSAKVCLEIENGGNTSSLRTIVGSFPQQKKTKFPYLELWEDHGVKLAIPLNVFNPSNFFEDAQCETNDSSKTHLVQVLIFQLKKIFEKVLRFSFLREEVDIVPVNCDRKQVAKTERMGDVHSHNESEGLHSVILYLSGCLYVWNGRGSAYKEFSFPNDMKWIEKEMHITNYLVDTFLQDSAHKPRALEIKCIFVPIMDFRFLEVDIIACNQREAFKPMVSFLLTLLQKWLR